MAKLIPLEEAAEMLGVTPDKLTQMRSRNEIFGYRDGSTWKFKDQEIQRVAKTMGIEAAERGLGSGVDLPGPDSGEVASLDIDAELDELVDIAEIDLDEDEDTDGPDSVLVSEEELGESDPGASSTIIGKSQVPDPDADLELNLSEEESSEELVLDLSDDDMDLAGKSAPLAKMDAGDEIKLEDSGLRLEGESDELGPDDSGQTLEVSADSGVQAATDDMQPSDSGSRLVLGEESKTSDPPAASSDLTLAADSSVAGGSELELDDLAAGSSAAGDLNLEPSSGDLTLQAGSGIDMGQTEESDEAILDDGALEIDDDAVDLEGADLVLEGGSAIDIGGSSINLDASGTGVGLSSGVDNDVTINAGDSGISLTSPSDSGISLEDTPAELAAGSDIEALELGEAEEAIDLGDEDVDLDEATLMGDDDFLLTPVEGVETEDADSGSQVIALDTDEISSAEQTELAEDFGEVEEATDLEAVEDGVAEVAPLGAAGGVAAAADAGYTIWNVVGLGICAGILAIGGMMITDLVRNMWSWDGTFSLNSALMDSVIGIFGG